MEKEIILIMEKIEKDAEKLKQVFGIKEMDELYEFFKKNGYKQSFEKFKVEVTDFMESVGFVLQKDSSLKNVSGGRIKDKLTKATSIGLASLIAVGSPVSYVSASEVPGKTALYSNSWLNSSLAKKLIKIGIPVSLLTVGGIGATILIIFGLIKREDNQSQREAEAEAERRRRLEEEQRKLEEAQRGRDEELRELEGRRRKREEEAEMARKLQQSREAFRKAEEERQLENRRRLAERQRACTEAQNNLRLVQQKLEEAEHRYDEVEHRYEKTRQLYEETVELYETRETLIFKIGVTVAELQSLLVRGRINNKTAQNLVKRAQLIYDDFHNLVGRASESMTELIYRRCADALSLPSRTQCLHEDERQNLKNIQDALAVAEGMVKELQHSNKELEPELEKATRNFTDARNEYYSGDAGRRIIEAGQEVSLAQGNLERAQREYEEVRGSIS